MASISENSTKVGCKTAIKLMNLFSIDMQSLKPETLRDELNKIVSSKAFYYFLGRNEKKNSEYMSMEKLEDIFSTDEVMMQKFLAKLSTKVIDSEISESQEKLKELKHAYLRNKHCVKDETLRDQILAQIGANDNE
jgi:hypothetical protein